MKNKIQQSFFLSVVFMNISFGAPEWIDESELLRERRGIESYVQNVEGREFHWAVGLVDEEIQMVAETIADMSRFEDWVPDVIEVKPIGEFTSTKWVFYNATDVRWPFEDRQAIVVMERTDLERSSIRITFDLEQDREYEWHEERVKVVASEGEWYLEPHDGKTRVYYRIHIDVGGGIPDSLAKPYFRKLPYDNIRALRGFLGN